MHRLHNDKVHKSQPCLIIDDAPGIYYQSVILFSKSRIANSWRSKGITCHMHSRHAGLLQVSGNVKCSQDSQRSSQGVPCTPATLPLCTRLKLWLLTNTYAVSLPSLSMRGSSCSRLGVQHMQHTDTIMARAHCKVTTLATSVTK